MQQLKEPTTLEEAELQALPGATASGARSHFRSYLVQLAAISGVVLSMVAGLNWLMNPYGAFTPPVIQKVNDEKPFLHSQERLYKSYAVIHSRPRTVILGSSRADAGLSPQHPGWTKAPVMNLGLAGAPLEVVADYFEHAAAVAPLEEALILMDYASSQPQGACLSEERDPWLDRLVEGKPVSRHWARMHQALLSWSGTSLSGKTLMTDDQDIRHQADGMVDNDDCWHRIQAKHRERPGNGWEEAFNLGVIPFVGTCSRGRGWEHLHRILQIAALRRIQVTFVISPIHDCLWQRSIADEGMETVLAWRAELVQEVNKAAASVNLRCPVVWDFALAEAASLSPAALKAEAAGGGRSGLPLYFESSHFTERLGTRVLDRVLLDPVGPDPVMGVQLTQDMLPEHLERLRKRWTSSQIASAHPLKKEFGTMK